jgi:hypothetical protein
VCEREKRRSSTDNGRGAGSGPVCCRVPRIDYPGSHIVIVASVSTSIAAISCFVLIRCVPRPPRSPLVALRRVGRRCREEISTISLTTLLVSQLSPDPLLVEEVDCSHDDLKIVNMEKLVMGG